MVIRLCDSMVQTIATLFTGGTHIFALGDSMLQGRVVLDCNHCPECNWGGDTLASCFKQIGTPAFSLSVQGLAKLNPGVLLGVL